MNITLPLLKHVNNLINNGDPIWAVLTINEYMDSENSFRQIMAKKALGHFESRSLRYRVLAVKLIKGGRLADLSDRMRTLIDIHTKNIHTKNKDRYPSHIAFDHKPPKKGSLIRVHYRASGSRRSTPNRTRSGTRMRAHVKYPFSAFSLSRERRVNV